MQLAQDQRLFELGYWFDPVEAQRPCTFFERVLVHSQGEFRGKPFILAPWQRQFVRRLFGWRRPDGTRRYRDAELWVPRKNGKSALLSGLALYLLIADGEAAAQVYCAASNKEQAQIVFAESQNMVHASPTLTELCEVYAGSMFVPRSGSRFRPLASKAASQHGLNIHGAIVDEVHTLPTRALYDVLTTASGARRQPLILVGSTAGDDIGSFGYELWDHAIKIRDGILDDPHYLAVVYAADPEDDWTSEDTWRKANPNLGVSVSIDYLRDQLVKARGNPGRETAFRQLYLNQWSQSSKAWLSVEKWDACNAKTSILDRLAGRACWGGLDLSKTTDLSALALVFPPEKPEDQDMYQVLVFFWCPEERAAERARKDRVQYPTWIAERHITATPGNVVDYAHIRRDINELAKRYRIQEIAFDRWSATQLVQELKDQDGMTMVEMGQGFASMSTPAQELERLILARKVRHAGNPVMRWMVYNVVVRRDPAGNIKPDKEKSLDRIDGVVALVMAVGRASLRAETGSVYDTAGIAEL